MYPSDLCERNIASELPEFVAEAEAASLIRNGHYLTKPVWDEETMSPMQSSI